MESAPSLSKEFLANKLAEINSTFNVSILHEELLVKEYSLSSATDFLTARIEEELNGEWSSATILQKLSSALKSETKWQDETPMHQIFPDKKSRRKQLQQIGEKLGYPIEKLLRPSKSTYGLCLVLLFLCIPAAIGISWFFSGVTALLLIFILVYLDRNGNEFRARTISEFAEEIEWRRNMELRKRANTENFENIKSKVLTILSS